MEAAAHAHEPGPRSGRAAPPCRRCLAGRYGPDRASRRHGARLGRHARAVGRTGEGGRRTLAACTVEGALAEVVSACAGPNVVTAWAVQLGAGPALLGAMWGLPQFAQLLQLPAAWLTSRYGRRRVAIFAVGGSRQVGLALLFLPFLALGARAGRTYVLAAFAISAVLAVLGHNAWLTWASNLVPGRLRGRYFGRRTAICTLIGTVAAVAAGRFLDHAAGRGDSAHALLLLTAMAALAGAASTAVMLLQHDPPGGPRPLVDWRELALPFSDPSTRQVLVVQGVWYAAVGLTASLSVLVMLRTLGLGFAGVSAYTATVAVMRTVSAPLWGRVLDRSGARGILVKTSFGVALLSALWLWAAPGRVWLIAVDAIVSGALLGGHQLALFTLPLAVAPREARSIYMAAFVMASGLAFGIASTVGGILTEPLAARWAAWGATTLFAVSAAGRAIAGALATRIVEPGHAGRAKA